MKCTELSNVVGEIFFSLVASFCFSFMKPPGDSHERLEVGFRELVLSPTSHNFYQMTCWCPAASQDLLSSSAFWAWVEQLIAQFATFFSRFSLSDINYCSSETAFRLAISAAEIGQLGGDKERGLVLVYVACPPTFPPKWCRCPKASLPCPVFRLHTDTSSTVSCLKWHSTHAFGYWDSAFSAIQYLNLVEISCCISLVK